MNARCYTNTSPFELRIFITATVAEPPPPPPVYKHVVVITTPSNNTTTTTHTLSLLMCRWYRRKRANDTSRRSLELHQPMGDNYDEENVFAQPVSSGMCVVFAQYVTYVCKPFKDRSMCAKYSTLGELLLFIHLKELMPISLELKMCIEFCD